MYLVQEDGKDDYADVVKTQVDNRKALIDDMSAKNEKFKKACIYVLEKDGKEVKRAENWDDFKKLVESDELYFIQDEQKSLNHAVELTRQTAAKATNDWDDVIYGRHGRPRGGAKTVAYGPKNDPKEWPLVDEVKKKISEIHAGNNKPVTPGICAFIGFYSGKAVWKCDIIKIESGAYHWGQENGKSVLTWTLSKGVVEVEK